MLVDWSRGSPRPDTSRGSSATINPEEAAAVRDLELPGIRLTKEPRRYYPSARAGPVLGFADIDGKGVDGVELAMNELLTGKKATVSAVRDASGELTFADSEMLESEPGAEITLTLDRNVQFVSERALADAVEKNKAKAGVAVVIEVRTGQILALANVPSYDPNKPGNAIRLGARNRAISDAYEIGSVMKVFTIAAALDAGAVSPTTVFDVEGGRFRNGRKMIRDSYRDNLLTVGGIMKRSSNIGAFKIARRLGSEKLHDALKRFGFGAKTGVELPGERAGFLRPSSRWGQTSLASVSYGYDLTVTPLQVTAALAAVGNGGVYYEPRIVAAVRDPSGRVVYQRKPEPRRVISATTAAALLPMLASVFEKGRKGGTARSLDVPGYRAGGKSGTAEKVDPKTRGYSHELHISSFGGLAPIDDPRIAVMVMIDEPADEHYGARVAGPAFAHIVSDTLRYLGVPAKPGPDTKATDSEPSDEASTEDSLCGPEELCDPNGLHGEPMWDSVPPGAETIVIPDFSGLGMGRALALARSLGVDLVVEGTGRAISQYPRPGRAVKPAELHLLSQTNHRTQETGKPGRSFVMKLRTLTSGIPGARIVGDAEVDVRSVRDDSRSVEPGDLFVAVRGRTPRPASASCRA